MTKETFNKIQKLHQDTVLDYINTNEMGILETFCVSQGFTLGEYFEYFELALKGFKDKYNQHNHPEHNKEE